MTLQEAMRILGREGFLGYFGGGYSTVDAVQDLMSKHPRGRGLKQGMRRERILYDACLVYQQARSRVRGYVTQ